MVYISRFIQNNKNYKNIYILFSAILLSSLFALTMLFLVRYSGSYDDSLIANDIEKLDQIFKQINKSAGILNFEQDKTYIDFLNVEKFAGSLVGGMNLVHPEKWHGPYVISNPEIQNKFYEIVNIKNNYYIVPGVGVKIKNNKVIGKDIIFDENSDIESMLKSSGLLYSNNKPLIAKINLYRELGQVNILEPVFENNLDI